MFILEIMMMMNWTKAFTVTGALIFTYMVLTLLPLYRTPIPPEEYRDLITSCQGKEECISVVSKRHVVDTRNTITHSLLEEMNRECYKKTSYMSCLADINDNFRVGKTPQ